MNRLISKCPACHGTLRVSTLQCPDCGMELRNTFDLSPFDRLDKEQFEFLITFLKDRGNLKEVQSDMQISYPTAKKKLDELLAALNLGGGTEKVMPKEIDVSRMDVDYTSTLASEIIKAKLKAHGGHITVYTARGLPCEIYAESDGTTFTSDKLPVKPAYDYKVFDDRHRPFRPCSKRLAAGRDSQCFPETRRSPFPRSRPPYPCGTAWSALFPALLLCSW